MISEHWLMSLKLSWMQSSFSRNLWIVTSLEFLWVTRPTSLHKSNPPFSNSFLFPRKEICLAHLTLLSVFSGLLWSSTRARWGGDRLKSLLTMLFRSSWFFFFFHYLVYLTVLFKYKNKVRVHTYWAPALAMHLHRL